MRRTDLLDTSPEAHRTYVRMLRRMTPRDKVERVSELIEAACSLKAAGEKWKVDLKRPSKTS